MRTTPLKIYKPRIRVLAKNTESARICSAFNVVSDLPTRGMARCSACLKDILVPRLTQKLMYPLAYEWKYTVSIRWYPNSQENLGKSTHAQTVNTRPLTEGCGLEARLKESVFSQLYQYSYTEYLVLSTILVQFDRASIKRIWS